MKDFFDQFDGQQGTHLFISHAHEDIRQVRRIRNALEEKGFEPLCFYLKCLNDETEQNRRELQNLIEREIDAREWFVYVNSENARRSRWVRTERNYVAQSKDKKILTVDLEGDPSSAEQAVETVLHNLRILITCSARDEETARRFREKLMQKDYMVFTAAQAPAEAEDALCRAAHDGCVLALLSEDAMHAPWVQQELELAFIQKGNILPVMLGDFPLSDRLAMMLATYQHYRLPRIPSDGDIDAVIHDLGLSITQTRR